MDEGPRIRRDPAGDAGLVSLLRAGDASAFGMLVDAWADPVYDRLSHHGFTTADALDLSVAIFDEAHRQVTEHSSTESFGVEVLRLAREQAAAADRLRVDLFLAVGPFAGDRLIHGTDPVVLAREESVVTFLLEVLALLGPSAGEVLDLSQRFAFGDREIAGLLRIPIDAVADLTVSTPDDFRELVGVQLVWRQGTPACTELAAALVRHTRLEAGTRRAIIEHLRGCATCQAAARPALDPVVVLAAIPISVAPAGFKPALVQTLAQIGLPVAGSVAYRLPPAARAMSAALPPPPTAPPVPSFVAAPPPPSPAPSEALPDRPAPSAIAAAPVLAAVPPLPVSAQREPELYSLMTPEADIPRRKVPFRFGSIDEAAASDGLAARDNGVDGDRLDGDGPHADGGDADEGEWAHMWVTEDVAPELSSALLAPPPPPNAPTPVVPSFERTYLSPAPAAELGSRRKRWFRAVEA